MKMVVMKKISSWKKTLKLLTDFTEELVTEIIL